MFLVLVCTHTSCPAVLLMDDCDLYVIKINDHAEQVINVTMPPSCTASNGPLHIGVVSA